jgi:hypothetical protein
MLRISVTGISDPTPLESEYARQMITMSLRHSTSEISEFSTGGAHGVDTIAAIVGFEVIPSAHHRICFPDNDPWNTGLLDLEVEFTEYVACPTYMKRNDALVAFCDVLLAFPRSPKELGIGSGTWATIRRARKANKGIVITTLDQTRKWTEYPSE